MRHGDRESDLDVQQIIGASVAHYDDSPVKLEQQPEFSKTALQSKSLLEPLTKHE